MSGGKQILQKKIDGFSAVRACLLWIFDKRYDINRSIGREACFLVAESRPLACEFMEKKGGWNGFGWPRKRAVAVRTKFLIGGAFL